MYRLEKKDVSYLNYLLENLNTFFSKYGIIDKPTQVIFKHALEAGITILEDKQNE